MTADTLAIVSAAALMWQTLLLIPMIPGKLIDTRDFSALPRWQYNGFNVFLTLLGMGSLATVAWLVAAPVTAAFTATAVLAGCYLSVFFADLMGVFPVVTDPPPTQLLVLEGISLASAGVLGVLAVSAVMG
ncbi:MAG: hypothetical protein ACK5KO_12310 [Arachnia sp.]